MRGIGGGIITKKLFLVALLMATLSFGSIATASAEEIEAFEIKEIKDFEHPNTKSSTATQTQIDNINSVDEKVNIQIKDTKTLNESAKTQKSVDKNEKTVENTGTATASTSTGQTTAKKQTIAEEAANTGTDQTTAKKQTIAEEAANTNADQTTAKKQTIAEEAANTGTDQTTAKKQTIAEEAANTNAGQTTVTPETISDNKTNTETSAQNTVAPETISDNKTDLSNESDSNHASGEITLATREQIRTAAVNVQNFIKKNGRVPRTVSVGGIVVDYAVFARMAAEELGQIQGSRNSDLEFRPVARASKSQTTLKNGNLNLAQYMDITSRVLNFMNVHERMPNYISTAFGRMSPEQFLDMISRTLGFYHQNNRLPNFAAIGRTVSAAPATESGNGSGGTRLPIPGELQSYLQATRNAQVTNAQIQNLAKQITGGSNDINAATRLFNWVRNNIKYSFYRNTQRGAVKALNDRKGNCVDQAHLLVALSRAAGIPARYVHGRCRFTSGNTYGHVWAEVWVKGRWYSVDSTSVRNTFGVIKSWSLISLHGRYTSLPF
jgi:hypothetical protein